MREINFFIADGEGAGQELFHLHLHVYPRFNGDEFGFKFNPHRGLLENQLEDTDRIASALRSASATSTPAAPFASGNDS